MPALNPGIHAYATFFPKYRSYSVWLGHKLRYSARRMLTFRLSVTKFIDRDRREFERCQGGNETTKWKKSWKEIDWKRVLPNKEKIHPFNFIRSISLSKKFLLDVKKVKWLLFPSKFLNIFIYHLLLIFSFNSFYKISY